MAHLWIQDAAGAWRPLPLEGDAFLLTGDPARPACLCAAESENGAPAVLRKGRIASQEAWVLLADPQRRAVRVNGIPLATGLRVLRDREEIRVGQVLMYLSMETMPRVEPFPGADRPAPCARCTQEMTRNGPAVRCAVCGAWHHEDPAESLPCWTYTPHCAVCGAGTGLASDWKWTPEEI